MRTKKWKHVALALLCFAAYVLIVWQRYDMYIGHVLTFVINSIHIVSGGLFAAIFYQWLRRTLGQDAVGYCFLLFMTALANGIFTAMAWGAWVGLLLSAVLMIVLFAKRKNFKE